MDNAIAANEPLMPHETAAHEPHEHVFVPQHRHHFELSLIHIYALHVPTGRPIQLTMISQDVFHSFSIPDFRIKREVIPGRYSTVWFEATTPGTYHLFCTQYCGTNHSAMIGEVTVLTPSDYKKWTEESTSGMSLAQNGERLFASLSCNACHNSRPDARGPSPVSYTHLDVYKRQAAPCRWFLSIGWSLPSSSRSSTCGRRSMDRIQATSHRR